MKTSIPFTIVIVFSSIFGFSQNYQTVQSNEIHYFATQNHDYFLASRTELVEMDGPDSVFYSFQTVREDENIPESDPCHYYIGAPWSGQKIVIKPDGRNIFYNKNNEPITIQTQAALNDTFLVYSYPNGDWIKGVVSNVIEIYILNDYDYVKIIDLFSNAPLELSDSRFIISENNGFVETYAFYSFPEPYTGAASVTDDNDFPNGYNGNFELVGIDTAGFHKPTTAEVFDFTIGDQFKFYSSEQNDDGKFVETFTQREVINKLTFDDSLVYHVVDTKQVTAHLPSGESITETSGGDADIIYYTNLDTWHTPYLPEEFNGSNGWSVLRINSCGDVEEIVRKQAVYFDGMTGCLIPDEYGSNLIYTAIRRVGWLAPIGESASGNIQYMSEMVYYEKADGSTCGTNQYLELENQPKSEMDFNVYPNPTSGDVYVKFDQSVSGSRVTVFDKSGRKVSVWKGQEQEDVFVDLSELSPGIYTLIIESDAGTQQEKVIKN